MICVIGCINFLNTSRDDEYDIDQEDLYEYIRKDFGIDCRECRTYKYVLLLMDLLCS